jgi:hypothetical protein
LGGEVLHREAGFHDRHGMDDNSHAEHPEDAGGQLSAASKHRLQDADQANRIEYDGNPQPEDAHLVHLPSL